ncbi:ester hydrolase C11orf54-like [Liolophura sinensis]|uniref:ester hydrolase C11orf54-like n=1 Tax=Liolophura sinensis TaxID=3198878 RepID=UPI003158DC31
MSSSLPVLKVPLHVPALEEVAKVLELGLKKNFADVRVDVVDCPDLTQPPFQLASTGLCGNPRLADVGGVPNLIPLANSAKNYNMEEMAGLLELPYGLLVGAGAGPNHVAGVNCEMACNIKFEQSREKTENRTCFFKVNPKDETHLQLDLKSTEFSLMANLFCSDGEPGKVIEAVAKRRTGPLSYMTCLRKALADHFASKPVGMGGTFAIEKGKAKLHIMPSFSKVPLTCDEDVDKWLKYYEMSAPIICVGELISHDPDLDLRMEHFHCYSDHGEGGHYHYDTTPNEVEYRGYFNIAEYMFRIDKPLETHMIGRD